jgi:hypothetical protein
MKKFKYRVFNMSEIETWNKKNPNARKTIEEVFNDLGRDGWEYKTNLTRGGMLFMREVDPTEDRGF